MVNDPEVRATLAIAQDEKVFGPIILGYPKNGFGAPKTNPPLPVKWM